MKLIPQSPKKALKAFLKQKPLRSEIDVFKTNLIALLDKISVIELQPTDESEEHLKNNLRDFLRDTYYRDTNAINTKDRKDLVIHLGKTTDSDAGVIIEAKRPTNINEMVSAENPNRKALHELILYYLDERNKAGNIQLKNLVITNVNEWYIVDANHFDKHIYRNTQIRKLYETKTNDHKDNPFFYEEIAKIIQKSDIEIPCVYFDIRQYNAILRNNIREDDKELSALFKILSPQHLLKIATPNDSNALNEKFYKELLHIIGLEEAREGTKNIIRRKIVNRNAASLIELIIEAIVTEDTLHRLPDQSAHGKTKDERLFNIALELCITWVNRILFLKLLESQLVAYHKSPASFGGGRKAEDDYLFLNTETIRDFDELFKLFHKVLAVNLGNRTDAIKSKYGRVPYLNSSLFEISELEDQIIKINSLDNDGQLELINTSILKETKKNTPKLPTLDYLFKFLDAYDFASEGTEEVQEDNKNIINASVLGKVFEKINGYKDGSIFTPGFITMYMCRISIRLAVIQKFREKYGWNIETFDDIKNYLSNRRSAKDILEFNAVINSLRICDPAVGSGHFLVSSLNELIVIKYELGLLADENGLCISDYRFEIINDELRIFGADNETEFTYLIPKGNIKTIKYRFGGDKYSFQSITHLQQQRIQKTLFHEKKTIIENCLFGVDINPNSVKICRLRLWIELLKNAYYKEENNYSELETLPNIDINIKCGNSLLSRFALDADLSKALKSIKYDIKAYRGFVNDYKNEKNRDVKRGLQKIIDGIKGDFRTEISKNSKEYKKLFELQYEYNLLVAPDIFKDNVAHDPKEMYGSKENFDKSKERIKKLGEEINRRTQEIREIENNVIYKNAFEWRFEFPEVLNNDGEFEGFDLIMGNPPYIALQKMQKEQKAFESQKYETYSKLADIYCLFYEKGFQLLKQKGLLTFITSNSWMRSQYGELLRKFFVSKTNPLVLLNIEDKQVFDEATVESSILLVEKGNWNKQLQAASLKEDFMFANSLEDYFLSHSMKVTELPESGWSISAKTETDLKAKIEDGSILLGQYGNKMYRGFTTGFNEVFFIPTEIKNKLIEEDPKCAELILPALRGKDISMYDFTWKDIWIILIKQGWTNKNRGNDDPEIYFKRQYPSVYNFFKNTGETIKGKGKGLFERDDKGDYWWELRPCVYYEEFEKEKIIWGELSDAQKFALDETGKYLNNTIFFITGKHLKYLISILNSRIAKWYFNEISTSSGMGTNRWLKYKVEQLPIKIISENDQQPFILLVNKILEARQQGHDTTGYEREIDGMVYKLYDLTEEEIKIVEGK